MASATVCFATNRQALLDQPGFGNVIQNPADATVLSYAVATVDNAVPCDANSGTITQISNFSVGGFDRPTLDRLAGSQDIVVFLHGFANSFQDGILRAAHNYLWLGGTADVVAFSWPSTGQIIAVPPHMLADDYLADQRMAAQSAHHIAQFFATMFPTFKAVRANGHKVFLLAHSMGNFALAGAVESWFASGRPALQLFDAVILAAPDENYNSFAGPANSRLHKLVDLTPQITLYYSERDVAMFLSTAVNLDRRLGMDGPESKGDLTLFPPALFRIADVSEVDDYNLVEPPSASHEYYRRSPRVRADILAIMGGSASPVGGGFPLL